MTRFSIMLLSLALAGCSSYGHIPIGTEDSGVCFGNSEDWNGLRFNFRDDGIHEVNGVNVTLWKHGPTPNGDVNGVGLGVYGNDGANLTGVFAGLLENTADETLTGIHVAAIDNRSVGKVSCLGAALGFNLAQTDLVGVHLAGGVNRAGKDMTGIDGALIAQLAGGDVTGVHLTGGVTHAAGSATGIQLSGLGTIAQEDLTGVSAALVATSADRDATGINVGGLTAVAGRNLTGLNAGLFGAFGHDSVRGISLGGLFVEAGGCCGDASSGAFSALGHAIAAPFHHEASEQDNHLCGIALAGIGTKADEVHGLTAALLHNSTETLTGLTIGACNVVGDAQHGVSIGLFNHASRFNGFGFQLGLLNHVPSNPQWARWLPLFNMQF